MKVSNKIVKQQKKEPYIIIGTPCLNDAPIEFTDALVKGLKNFPYKYDFVYAKGALPCEGRDMIVREAIKQGATHIMFIDSDIVFPSGSIEKLINHNTDICSGLYFLKHFHNCTPVAWDKLGVREDNGRAVARPIPKETAMQPYVEVDAVGFGFVLLKVECLSAVAKEYNAVFMHDYGAGEDIAFCIRAKQLGYKVMLDTTIPLIHLGSYGYSRADFLRTSKEGDNG